jgi:hypothetical protein
MESEEVETEYYAIASGCCCRIMNIRWNEENLYFIRAPNEIGISARRNE